MKNRIRVYLEDVIFFISTWPGSWIVSHARQELGPSTSPPAWIDAIGTAPPSFSLRDHTAAKFVPGFTQGHAKFGQAIRTLRLFELVP